MSHEYVMSHTDAERRRLALQGSIINPFAERLLRDAGVVGGMHVLDLGCGVGDVSLIAGRLVGAHGSVTGVDLDPDALALAAERAEEEGLNHVRFVRGDLQEFQPERLYDAVVGRLILIHTPDPVALIRRASGFVVPGGIVAFQDLDSSFCGPKYEGMPMWDKCTDAITAFFQRVQLPARAGSLLYRWFLDAGLPAPDCRLEYFVDGGADSLYYEWLTGTMRSLLPKMEALGVVAKGEIEIDRLEETLRREAVSAGQPLVVGPMGGAFARTGVH